MLSINVVKSKCYQLHFMSQSAEKKFKSKSQFGNVQVDVNQI